MEQFGQEVAEETVDIEERIAVAKGKVGTPARPPQERAKAYIAPAAATMLATKMLSTAAV